MDCVCEYGFVTFVTGKQVRAERVIVPSRLPPQWGE